jgi:hypothetical protein
MLALYTLAKDDLEGAERYAAEALSTFTRTADLSGMMLVAWDFGILAMRRGDTERWMRVAGAMDALTRTTGVAVIGSGFDFLDWRAPEPPTDEEGQLLWNEGASWTIDQLVDYVSPGSSGARA